MKYLILKYCIIFILKKINIFNNNFIFIKRNYKIINCLSNFNNKN